MELVTTGDTAVASAVESIRRTGSLRALEGLEDAQVIEVTWALLQSGHREAAGRIVEAAIRNLGSPVKDFRLRACRFLLGMHRFCGERGRPLRLAGRLEDFVEALEREENPRVMYGLVTLTGICVSELREKGRGDLQLLERAEKVLLSVARRGDTREGRAAGEVLSLMKVGGAAAGPAECAAEDRTRPKGRNAVPLSHTRAPLGVADLVSALKAGELEPSPSVASICLELGDPFLKALSELVEGNVREGVILKALELLELMGNGAAMEMVRKAADHPIPEVRARALASLRKMSPGDPRLLPLFMRALKDEEVAVRREAVRGMEAIEDPQCVETLISILRRKSPRGGAEHPAVEEAACLALARLGSESAVAPLMDLLRRRPFAVWKREAHPRVKAAACQALAEIGGPEAAELIRGYLDDPDPILRNEARKAVATMRSRGLLD